ncbi:hypothetical protein EZS27_016007, partial [termite gut metagenome]
MGIYKIVNYRKPLLHKVYVLLRFNNEFATRMNNIASVCVYSASSARIDEV